MCSIRNVRGSLHSALSPPLFCPVSDRSFGAALFARDAGVSFSKPLVRRCAVRPRRSVLGVCRLALLFEPARGAALFVRLAGLVGERTCVPPPRRCEACRVRNECRRSTCICWTGRRVNNNPGLMRCSRTNNSGLLVEYEDPISDMRPPPRRCEACRVRNECRRSTCICWTGRLRAKPSSTSADSRLQ